MPKQYWVSIALHVLLVVALVFCTVGAATGSRNRTRPSRWLAEAVAPSRLKGCWMRPWICNRGEKPFRWKMMCCRNKCVNVRSDPYNCGFCGIRCPFTWQCCNGFCRDTNLDPFHCGSCSKRCPFGSLCLFGMCGYSQPLSPFPSPFPPLKPNPPPFEPELSKHDPHSTPQPP